MTDEERLAETEKNMLGWIDDATGCCADDLPYPSEYEDDVRWLVARVRELEADRRRLEWILGLAGSNAPHTREACDAEITAWNGPSRDL